MNKILRRKIQSKKNIGLASEKKEKIFMPSIRLLNYNLLKTYKTMFFEFSWLHIL